ncbi:MAG: hypothetical protein J6127_03385 [Clostridiales bacterium]|nr:hypothetical protein [Clostridiales bacterium]
MPHHSGGGSHHGGSHGGSRHGSSRSTRSHHYFRGARRYRRRYRDGREDYFYSNVPPRKQGLGGIIFMILFGGIFTSFMGFGFSKAAKVEKLEASYRTPSSFVYDNIDVIDNESELEDALERFNDETGICPLVYTEYTQTCLEHNRDIPDYTFDLYLRECDDEQHFVIVYAIPEDQADAYREGQIDIPDYDWEAVQGDDTDGLLTEGIFDVFSDKVQNNLEGAMDPGEAFADAFDLLTDRIESRIENQSSRPAVALIPVLIIAAFFLFMLIPMIKRYIDDKNTVYEEVPLTEDDNKLASSSSGSGMPEVPPVSGTATGLISVFMIIFLVPFIVVGITTLSRGIAAVSKGESTGMFLLAFGAIWTTVVCVFIVGMVKSIRGAMRRRDTNAPLTAEYPKAEYPKAEYPEAEYPEPKEEETYKSSFGSMFGSVGKSNVDYDDDDYDDMRRKGYE